MEKKKNENKSKMKKGYLAVHVGLEDTGPSELHKFVIPIKYLYHPRFNGLLNRASDIYGYHVDGPLRLPCSVDDFVQIQRSIEQDGGRDKRLRHLRHPIFSNHDPK